MTPGLLGGEDAWARVESVLADAMVGNAIPWRANLKAKKADCEVTDSAPGTAP
jgi:hypothetical protein